MKPYSSCGEIPDEIAHNHGKTWKEEELDTLKRLFLGDMPLRAICETLGRQPGGVLPKLVNMKLLIVVVDGFYNKRYFALVRFKKFKKEDKFGLCPAEHMSLALDYTSLELRTLAMYANALCQTGLNTTPQPAKIMYANDLCQTGLNTTPQPAKIMPNTNTPIETITYVFGNPAKDCSAQVLLNAVRVLDANIANMKGLVEESSYCAEKVKAAQADRVAIINLLDKIKA